MDRKIFHPAWGLAHDFARTTILNLSTDLTRAKSGACPHVPCAPLFMRLLPLFYSGWGQAQFFCSPNKVERFNMGKEQKNRASPLAGFNNSFCKLPLSFQVEKMEILFNGQKNFPPRSGTGARFCPHDDLESLHRFDQGKIGCLSPWFPS
jgi:hypothetical protein